MNESLASSCIYTVRHSEALAADYASGGIGEFTESGRWTTGMEILKEARKAGLSVPLLFAPADADTSGGVTYWAFVDDIKVTSEGTKVRFFSLNLLSRRRRLSSLTKLSTGGQLSDNYIRPYVPCKTPEFLKEEKNLESPGKEWSDEEIAAAVDAYLEMLGFQTAGRSFKKSEFNAKLREGALSKRTKSSVEFRMQNISAVLKKEGRTWLEGYVPAENVGLNVRARITKFLNRQSLQTPRKKREHLLDAIKADHILKGIELFNSGHPHSFDDSTKFDLVFKGKSYPPKAIIGLAAVPLYGEPLKPEDFSGGAGSKCFRVLVREGFKVLPKASEFQPTADEVELKKRTREALLAPMLPKPAGQKNPRQSFREVPTFERDPLVRAFVLRRAEGKCECCGYAAPFSDELGQPFLEVHHIHPLGKGGDDTVENAAAICPNCHRECHYGQNAPKLFERLIQFVQKLSV